MLKSVSALATPPALYCGAARPIRHRTINIKQLFVRPDLLVGVGAIEHIVQLLTVVHGRVGRMPFADQLVRLVHAEMVLVAVEAFVVPLRPARVLVLLGILGGLLLPSLRRLAGLDRLVLLLRVALLGHRHNRGVNDLAAARNVALGLEMLAEAREQLVDQPGLRQRLAKQPDRGGIRYWLLEFQIEKAHERQPVADQVLVLLVREIVERLQHHDLELQDRVIGLAAGVALALLGLRLRHRLDVSAEILPSHHLLDRLQRIALAADRLQPALNIEKALLPHDSLAPSAHYRVRSPSQIRGDLARGIFRGALVLVTLAWLSFVSIAAAQTSAPPNPDLPARRSNTDHLRGGWYPWDPYQYRAYRPGVPILTGFDVEIERALARIMSVEILLPQTAWEDHLAAPPARRGDIPARAPAGAAPRPYAH